MGRATDQDTEEGVEAEAVEIIVVVITTKITIKIITTAKIGADQTAETILKIEVDLGQTA